MFEIGEIVDCVFGINAGYQVEVLAGAPLPFMFRGEPTIHTDGDYICTSPGLPSRRWQVFAATSLRKRRPPEQYKDQFTPADKSLDEIIRDANKRPTRISG